MTSPVIIGPDTGTKAVCVILHGRGQTQADMAEAVVNRLDITGVRYVLPKSARPAWHDAGAFDPLTEITVLQSSLSDLLAARPPLDGGAG